MEKLRALISKRPILVPYIALCVTLTLFIQIWYVTHE